jgi:hypothetical protein
LSLGPRMRRCVRRHLRQHPRRGRLPAGGLPLVLTRAVGGWLVTQRFNASNFDRGIAKSQSSWPEALNHGNNGSTHAHARTVSSGVHVFRAALYVRDATRCRARAARRRRPVPVGVGGRSLGTLPPIAGYISAARRRQREAEPVPDLLAKYG